MRLRPTPKPEKVTTDTPNFKLSDTFIQLGANDRLTFADIFQSIFVAGMPGSGKTSGPRDTFLRQYFRHGFGMCALTVKPEEKEEICAIAEEEGRGGDIACISPTEKRFYDFMDAEAKRGKGSETETLVSLLSLLVEIAQGQQKSSDSYWVGGQRQLTRNAVCLLQCAEEQPCTVEKIYRLVISAPNSTKQLNNKEYREDSYCFKVLEKAAANVDRVLKEGNAETHHRDFDICLMYWTKEFPNLAEKTRSILVSMLSTTTDLFMRGSLKTIFSSQEGKQPCSPELAREQRKIIIMDTSIKVYEDVGKMANSLYATLFMKAMERKPLKQTGVGVALVMDEFQHFLTDYLYLFLQTSRSAGVSVCALTQSINNLITAYGDNGETKAYNLLALFGQKLACKNTCVKTNAYFSELIGQDWDDQYSSSVNLGDDDEHLSSSVSSVRRYKVEPITFTDLMSGGVENNLLVEAIAHNGRTWSNGEKHLRCYFKQQ